MLYGVKRGLCIYSLSLVGRGHLLVHAYGLAEGYD